MTLSLTTDDDTGREPGRSADPGSPPAPHADCVSDEAGDITFTVAVPPAGGRWETLLLQRRGGDTAADSVHLPLTESPGGGSLTGTLPLALRLAEGRWDAHVTRGESQRIRLRPGVNDLRTLADDAGRARRTEGAVCLPYTTKYGNLSVRTWLRWPHAEAGRIHLRDHTGTVEALLLGAELTDAACLEARARALDAPALTVPVTREGPHVTARLDLADLAGRQPAERDRTEWELWLRPDGAGGRADAVRLARILDDVPDKRAVYRYPAVRVARNRTAAFAYTGAGDLSVEVHGLGERRHG
ncbi:hypothetical protein GCM10023347_18600 [Streptomyces chumphonensis]|uniref:Transferase n=1 Tax=Streptomyces chumphonensis TaxID=1214925 RepID=A0A927EZA3_9ACTN|nr:hypothetical protein [Streptomyces chumphonensis]MBD3931767.1 hypothetical protein [Streptomyces chumphonensis]